MNVDAAADRRKKEIEKYFNKPPDVAHRKAAVVIMGLGAAIVILALLSFIGDVPILGVILLGIAGYEFYKGFEKKSEYDRQCELSEPKLSDEDMDRRLRADLIRIRSRATERLGLTADDIELSDETWDPLVHLDRGNPLLDQPHRHPFLVFGPLLSAPSAVGKDGIWRFAGYEVMVICPTSYQLAVYRCALDFLTGGLRHEETQEFHYVDVVAVSTTTSPLPHVNLDPVDLRTRQVGIHFAKAVARQFQIVVSSGDRSKIVVGILDDAHPDNEPLKLRASNIEKVIKSVRRMLREKKGGAGAASPSTTGD